MKVFEMFAGVGGFSQAFPPDWEIVGFSEIDRWASSVLKYHYPNTKNYGNCESIKWRDVPDFNLLTGGSPCQNFSIAGKRAGIVGSKSRLVWEFIRCLREKQPEHFIFENVKGLLSSRGGWDFANILVAFSECGYNLWWQVLNAKDFGVPQNRERVFVIGYLGEKSPPEVFFEPKDDKDVIEKGERELSSSIIARTITATEHKQHGDGNYVVDFRYDEGMRIRKEFVSPTLTRSSEKGLSGKGYIIQEKSIRRFTPTECERLMSWSDGHTKYGVDDRGHENCQLTGVSVPLSGRMVFCITHKEYLKKVEISDSQRYHQCGNGVVSDVITHLIKNSL